MMPSYKLTYFNVRGRAEPTRLLFAAAGLEYEDCRIPFEGFGKLKASGKLPFGQVPILEVNGKILAQSLSIFKFVARETGFSPSESFEIAQADMASDSLVDLCDKYVTIIKEKDKEKKEALKTALHEIQAPVMMTHFEKMVKVNDGQHFAGSKISYADILFFAYVDEVFKEEALAILEKYPLLKNLFSKVKSQPGIAKWLKERPASDI